MARGFLSGVIWGGVASVLGAATLSVALPRPQDAGVMPPQAEPAAVASTEAAPPAQAAPMPAAPEPDEAPPPETAAAAPVDADTMQEVSADAPTSDVGAAQAEAELPDRDATGTLPAAETSVAASEAPDSLLTAPAAPGEEAVDTQALAQPEVGAAPDTPGDAPAEGSSVQISVASDAPVLPGAQADVPGAPTPDAALDISADPAQPPQPGVSDVQSPLAPITGELPEEDAAAPEPPTEADTADVTGQDASSEAEDTADVLRPSIGTPAVSLVNRDSGEGVRRLPGSAASEDALTDGAETDAAAEDNRPLARFAVKVPAAAELPRMSILLIDDGKGPLGPEALEAFPFPVTFAVAPGHPEAAETARKYRALGFEVMAIAELPEGAQATDVEIALAGAIDAVPQAVAVLEDPDGGLQETRAVTTQASAFLAASGHGLVMQPRGLNTAQQLAARDGVPSATLFRDFDNEGQDARVIRRFLDQAAFRARQEGSVVMMGRLQADTISALVLWGLQDRAATVALVPVSTVLLESAQN